MFGECFCQYFKKLRKISLSCIDSGKMNKFGVDFFFLENELKPFMNNEF